MGKRFEGSFDCKGIDQPGRHGSSGVEFQYVFDMDMAGRQRGDGPLFDGQWNPDDIFFRRDIIRLAFRPYGQYFAGWILGKPEVDGEVTVVCRPGRMDEGIKVDFSGPDPCQYVRVGGIEVRVW